MSTWQNHRKICSANKLLLVLPIAVAVAVAVTLCQLISTLVAPARQTMLVQLRLGTFSTFIVLHKTSWWTGTVAQCWYYKPAVNLGWFIYFLLRTIQSIYLLWCVHIHMWLYNCIYICRCASARTKCFTFWDLWYPLILLYECMCVYMS